MSDKFDEQAAELINDWLAVGDIGRSAQDAFTADIASALRATAEAARRGAVEECGRVAVKRAGQFHEAWKGDINDNYLAGKRDGADTVADLIRALLDTPSPADPTPCRHPSLTRPDPEWECTRCGERFGRGTCAEAAERARDDLASPRVLGMTPEQFGFEMASAAKLEAIRHREALRDAVVEKAMAWYGHPGGYCGSDDEEHKLDRACADLFAAQQKDPTP